MFDSVLSTPLNPIFRHRLFHLYINDLSQNSICNIIDTIGTTIRLTCDVALGMFQLDEKELFRYTVAQNVV